MEIHKCDRCGATYEKNTRFAPANTYITSTVEKVGINTTGNSPIWYDMCDTCLGEFNEFMLPAVVLREKSAKTTGSED